MATPDEVQHAPIDVSIPYAPAVAALRVHRDGGPVPHVAAAASIGPATGWADVQRTSVASEAASGTVSVDCSQANQSAIYASNGAEGEAEEAIGNTSTATGPAPTKPQAAVAGPPEGAGALFKCAICQELVYESQLDFHVTVCPDPTAAAASTSPSIGPGPCQQAATMPAATGYGLSGAAQGSIPSQTVSGPRHQPSQQHQQDQGYGTVGVDASMQPGQQHQRSTQRRARSLGSLGQQTRGRTVGTPRGAARQHGLSPRSVSAERVAMVSPSQVTDIDCVSPSVDGRSTGGQSQERALWRQWKNSALERHHVEANRSWSRRRQELKEELARKESEECTFSPRLVARRPSSTGATVRARPANSTPAGGAQTADAEFHARQRQHSVGRQQKLERIEAEQYAEATYRPQISRFAQAWSARERGTSAEGRSPPVYERLYKVAAQTREARESRMLKGDLGDVSSLTPGTPGQFTPRAGSLVDGQGSGLSRTASAGGTKRPSVVNLLYGDALDRRQRQRALQERLSENEDAERRAACQVLGKSRRYYWQMLERQIKDAFDASTVGAETLMYPAFDGFLKHFGVIRPPRSSTPIALERAAEESRRLRVALWRHLDPQKTGYCDFLTLTVFFHVLMGAVDEEAECLHNLSAAQQLLAGSDASLENAEQPGESVPAADGASPAAAAGNLSAIFEESAPPAEHVNSAVEAAASAAAAADPEGRRICELLMRFDARQLRVEFQQLYLDRMLNAKNAEPPVQQQQQQQQPHSPARRPEVNSHSRTLADRLANRQAKEPGLSAPRTEQLHGQHAQREAKLEEKRARRDADEVQGCTFRPDLTRTRRAKSAERQPRGLYSRLYQDACERQQTFEAKLASAERDKNMEELKPCTFRPDIRKTTRAPARQPMASPVPRGYDESKLRMRKAFEGQSQKRRALEDRFVAINAADRFATTPTGSAASPVPRNGDIAVAAANSAAAALLNGSGMPSPGSPLPGSSDLVALASPSSPGLVGIDGMQMTNYQEGQSSSSACQPAYQPAQPHQRYLGERGTSQAGAPPTFGGPTTAMPGTIGSAAAVSASGSICNRPQSAGSSHRRPVSAATASPRGSRAPAFGARAQGRPPQGAARREQPAPAGRPPPKASTTSQPPAALPASRRSPPAAIPPPASTTLLPGSAAADIAAPEDAAAQSSMVYVEVNIAPGRPPERLVLKDGQSPMEAAADFAVKHRLSPALAQRLHVLLQDLLTQPDGLACGTASS
eukprot:TRINITY_DN9228_c0_g1_i7.p1 TRINITY_DN9228_c0_g1~~TRINITY_DN9228_c0_g1_i7.p1  ORF type:complete len:1244 (-),score=220.33 TRINITY_DN9228_c0_g1_i7:151-3882(-)